ncbi:hypothetical protein BDZ94DRAFT_1310989 [Collybia nuda]|uniref:Uncharacterized protein n=1 Tax=Collybia nuda TaxID=64659 RepID=A0A9P6CHL3_9AGAR|nr:hypothetical protein BDZ94DRAFT_1310989 [Collybia nuda]
MSYSNSTRPTLITSQIFCDPAADVVFKSCDNVLFHIDRKNLEVTTGGFPPPGFRSEGEYTELTESAATLELLFSFVYPSRHPPLMEVDFEVFADFAEAAEKYEVFCAIHTANTKMREAIQDHPIEVMNYASRHGYPELLDAAAPLTLDIPFDQIADTMNINILPAWARTMSLHCSTLSNS